MPAQALDTLRPPTGPRTIVLVVGGAIPDTAVPGLCERVRRLLQGAGADLVTCEMRALADPDPVAIDALARLQLTARRLGGSIQLRNACRQLQDLLDLTGLREVFPLCVGLRLELRGQAEEREQARLDEEMDPTDPTR